MIGILDYNLCTSSKIIIPNLEVMKLATYYRLEERHFCRLLSLEEENLGGYDKIYFFSDDPDTTIPQNYKRATNVEYRGLCFTKGIYEPFENPIIDFTLPRTFIYKDYLQRKMEDDKNLKAVNHFLDDCYYRMYAGDERLPIPAVMTNKRVILYDTEFFYPDWRQIMDDIASRKPSSVVRLHPVVCHSLTDFFELRQYPKFARTNEVILDLPLPLEELNALFRKYEKHFLADITISSNVYITLGGDLKMKKLYRDDFVYKLNLLYSFWARGIPLKVKYVKPQKQMVNPIEDLCLAVESWAALDSPTKLNTTLGERVKKGTKHEQFEEMGKWFKDMDNLAAQGFNVLKERGYWRC